MRWIRFLFSGSKRWHLVKRTAELSNKYVTYCGHEWNPKMCQTLEIKDQSNSTIYCKVCLQAIESKV